MAEKINPGANAMGTARANLPTSPACGQWETLLADALDGLLRPEDEATFSTHMAGCAYCTELFEQARRGREWLEFLAPEPEVPAHLLEKILAETGHGKPGEGRFAPRRLAAAGGLDEGNLAVLAPAWQRPGVGGFLRRFAEPRLLMTAAMAFFSIALTLSLTGVRFTAVRISDLRPASIRSALEKRIMTASTPIVRYYDHLRFVYEVESTVRQIRRTTDSEQSAPGAVDDKSPAKPQPAGESHQKEGGSRLEPGVDPKTAPQQTGNPRGNPPAPLWGSDVVEARLELVPRGYRGQFVAASIRVATIERIRRISEKAASLPADFFKTGALAMPERSVPCLA